MIAHGVTPILNVSNFAESVAWFERLGWRKHWDWGDPSTFGAVSSGKVEIFLCHDGQGGRGKGTNKTTFSGEEDSGKGVWMSIWVDDVDSIHQHCLTNDIEVTLAPTDFPWGCRELHIRHPDGHVFRISKGIECQGNDDQT